MEKDLEGYFPMAIAQPRSDDFLNSPDHSKLHRVLGVDADGPDQGLAIDASGNILFSGSGQFASDKAIYFGGTSENDSWRMIRSGSGLNVERRDGGIWAVKGTFG